MFRLIIISNLDLNKFLVECSSSLEKRFSNVSLEMVFSCHHRIDRDMKDLYAKMVEDAHLLCHGSIHCKCNTCDDELLEEMGGVYTTI